MVTTCNDFHVYFQFRNYGIHMLRLSYWMYSRIYHLVASDSDIYWCCSEDISATISQSSLVRKPQPPFPSVALSVGKLEFYLWSTMSPTPDHINSSCCKTNSSYITQQKLYLSILFHSAVNKFENSSFFSLQCDDQKKENHFGSYPRRHLFSL